MKALIVGMLALLMALPAFSQSSIGGKLGAAGTPGYIANFDSSDAAGTYILGSTTTNFVVNFNHDGGAFSGNLYDCDTMAFVAASCDLVTALTGDVSKLPYTGGRVHLVVVISTAASGSEITTLIVKGDYSASAGGGALDNLITADLACATDTVFIPAVTGIYNILPASGCLVGETIEIAAVGVSGADAILITVVNDMAVDLTVDGTTNNTVTNESGSLVVPAGSTFSVVQVDGNSVIHIIGTGSLATGLEANTGIVNGRIDTLVEFGSGPLNWTEVDVVGRYQVLTDTITINLPPVAATAGLNFCAHATTPIVVTINPDDADRILLDGVNAGDGTSIFSDGNIGDKICLLNTNAAGWIDYDGDPAVWTITP
jgi:hypothetical protein